MNQRAIGRCYVTGCNMPADHSLPDADNDNKPFLICDMHYLELKKKQKETA